MDITFSDKDAVKCLIRIIDRLTEENENKGEMVHRDRGPSIH